MKEICLISCSKKKKKDNNKILASERYNSPLFNKMKAYASSSRFNRWYILSAKHHLLSPEECIGDYDETLNTMSSEKRKKWAKKVFEQLQEKITSDDKITILAGKRYWEYLGKELSSHKYKCDIPMKGLHNGIGEQLKWLNNQLLLILNELLVKTPIPYKDLEGLKNNPENNLEKAGIYAWWFKDFDDDVVEECRKEWKEAKEKCERKDVDEWVETKKDCKKVQLTLLYVGITGKNNRNIIKRLKEHYKSNAEASTLRYSLGCLLGCELSLEGKIKTFGEKKEMKLSGWMKENACVSWIDHKNPEELENTALKELVLPLNIKENKNQDNSFPEKLKELRKTALDKARKTRKTH